MGMRATEGASGWAIFEHVIRGPTVAAVFGSGSVVAFVCGWRTVPAAGCRLPRATGPLVSATRGILSGVWVNGKVDMPSCSAFVVRGRGRGCAIGHFGSDSIELSLQVFKMVAHVAHTACLAVLDFGDAGNARITVG